MCGIFGWALNGPNRQNRETRVRLTDLMAHRGPDGSGCLLFDSTDGGFQIGLGTGGFQSSTSAGADSHRFRTNFLHHKPTPSNVRYWG